MHHHDFSWIVLDNFGESEDIASILSTMSNRVAAVRIGEMMTLDTIPDHISIVSVTSRSYLYPIVYVTISNLNLNMPMLTKAQDWRARYLFRVTFWYILIWMPFVCVYVYIYVCVCFIIFIILYCCMSFAFLSVRNPCFPPWPWICQVAGHTQPALSQRRTLEMGRHQSPASPCVHVHLSYDSTPRCSP